MMCGFPPQKPGCTAMYSPVTGTTVSGRMDSGVTMFLAMPPYYLVESAEGKDLRLVLVADICGEGSPIGIKIRPGEPSGVSPMPVN